MYLQIGLFEKFLIMKRLLLILILTLNFQIWTKADDIKDLEMEGLSIGDSLLSHLSKKEIMDNYELIYLNEKSFSKDIAGIFYNKNLSEYDAVQVDFKLNDSDFTIVGLSGYIIYENDLNSCYKKQNEIFDDLNSFFNNVETLKGDMEDHPGYPKGEVRLKRFSFFLSEEERSNLEIICFEALNAKDRLSVSMKSTEFNEWMFKLHN